MAEEEYDAREPKDARLGKREKASKRERDQELADLDWVLSDPRGRRYVTRVSCEKERWLLTPMHSNSNWSSFYKGKAECALTIMKEIRDERPEMFLKMQQELILTTKENGNE